MDAYGIERRDLDDMLKTGMKWKEQQTNKWHAAKGGFECVFVHSDEGIIVITVYRTGGKR